MKTFIFDINKANKRTKIFCNWNFLIRYEYFYFYLLDNSELLFGVFYLFIYFYER